VGRQDHPDPPRHRGRRHPTRRGAGGRLGPRGLSAKRGLRKGDRSIFDVRRTKMDLSLFRLHALAGAVGRVRGSRRRGPAWTSPEEGSNGGAREAGEPHPTRRCVAHFGHGVPRQCRPRRPLLCKPPQGAVGGSLGRRPQGEAGRGSVQSRSSAKEGSTPGRKHPGARSPIPSEIGCGRECRRPCRPRRPAGRGSRSDTFIRSRSPAAAPGHGALLSHYRRRQSRGPSALSIPLG
jgi:hypothetical protein